MQWFFDRISTTSYPVIFGYQYQKSFGSDFNILRSHGLITHSANLDELDCDLCDEYHTTQIRHNGNILSIVCEKGCGCRSVNNEELALYRYQPTKLFSLFQLSLGITTPKIVENIQGLLWSFGAQEINGETYQLFFTNDINKIDTIALSITTELPKSVLFYVGIPNKTFPKNIYLIPLLNIIKDITKQGLEINSELVDQYFATNLHHTKEGVVNLDNTMVLQGTAILYDSVRSGTFKKSVKIRPFAKRIIERLYQIRKYKENSMTLEELGVALSRSKNKTGRKVSISNEIKRVEDICSENNLKPILYKFNDEKWGINPQLDCCQ